MPAPTTKGLTEMHPKRLSPLSAAARMMGKKGGKRTLELHGAEHFSKASQGTESFWRWVAQKKGQGSRRAGRKPEERNNRQTSIMPQHTANVCCLGCFWI